MEVGPSKPEWIKIRYETNDSLKQIKEDVAKKGIATVCQSSLCPNISECWGGGTATFMLMGDTCTRACRFCFVKTSSKPQPLDSTEHEKLLDSVKTMGLTYAVLTTVDRDELEDQGANHLAKCISHIKENIPGLMVEILCGDFRGDKELLKVLADSKPEVIAHNIETVERLTPRVRDRRANYKQSLEVLKNVKEINPKIFTKSSIMVGLGETKEEVEQAMEDLRAVDCDFLTIGQYLMPSFRQLKVEEYLDLETFKYYEELGYKKGFKYVASGPFVRSSYKAGELFIESVLRGEKSAREDS